MARLGATLIFFAVFGFISLLIFGAFVAVMLKLLKGAKRSKSEWRQDAASLGMTLEYGPPRRLVGNHKGVAVRVTRIAERKHQMMGSNTRVVYYSLIEMKLENPHPPGLRIANEGMGTKLGKMFGAEDIEIGHEQFDSALRVQAESEEQARAYLDRPGVVEAFGRLYGIGQHLRLEASVLSVRFQGVRHGLALRQMLDMATAQARIIDDRVAQGPRQASA